MERIKILVFEDEPHIQKLFDKALKDDVFEKRFASDGEAGLAIYKEWGPDIILLDMGLPIIPGYNVLRIIREDIGDKDTSIIMQTSRSDKGDITACIKLGIQGYIVKPFSYKEIAPKILTYYKAVNPEKAGAALAGFDKPPAAGKQGPA